MLAHVREKVYMIDKTIDKESETLGIISDEANQLRIYLNRTKVKRDMMRKVNYQMSQSCGILDRTELLYDYDVSQRTTKEQKETIKKLQVLISELESETESILAELN